MAKAQAKRAEFLKATAKDEEIHARLAQAKRELKAAADEVERLSAIVKERMGDYTEMFSSNGYELLYTYKAHITERFDSKSFKEAHPRIYSKFVIAAETRPLLVK